MTGKLMATEPLLPTPVGFLAAWFNRGVFDLFEGYSMTRRYAKGFSVSLWLRLRLRLKR
jgi:hypothetical protein